MVWNPDQDKSKKVWKKYRRFCDQCGILIGGLFFSVVYILIVYWVASHPMGSCYAHEGDLIPAFKSANTF